MLYRPTDFADLTLDEIIAFLVEDADFAAEFYLGAA